MKLSKASILRFGALVAAFWFLLSGIGISVSIHYCNGNIIDFAIDKRANACDGYFKIADTSPIGCSFSRKGCCADYDQLLVLENDYPPSKVSEVPDPLVLASTLKQQMPIVEFQNLWTDDSANPPPLIQYDYLVLFQIFLI